MAPASPAQTPRFPPELTLFKPLQDRPVFTGAPGQWDAFIRERGWILREGELWKLYYTGYDSPDGVRRLGLATSEDGIHWTRYRKNPLVADQWIEDVMIVKDEGTYFLFAEGKEDRAHLFQSRDGLAWERLGQLDIRKSDGTPISDGPYGTPTAFKEHGTWHLFYERNDVGVWLATSRDLKVWTNVQDEPVMKPGPDLYYRDLIAVNQVIRHEGRYYAYYHGCANIEPKTKRRWCTCLAVSDDLRRWTKYPNNPLLPLDENKSSGIVVSDGGGFRLYTMHPAVYVHGPAAK